jgi:hypothetical protein
MKLQLHKTGSPDIKKKWNKKVEKEFYGVIKLSKKRSGRK